MPLSLELGLGLTGVSTSGEAIPSSLHDLAPEEAGTGEWGYLMGFFGSFIPDEVGDSFVLTAVDNNDDLLIIGDDDLFGTSGFLWEWVGGDTTWVMVRQTIGRYVSVGPNGATEWISACQIADAFQTPLKIRVTEISPTIINAPSNSTLLYNGKTITRSDEPSGNQLHASEEFVTLTEDLSTVTVDL